MRPKQNVSTPPYCALAGRSRSRLVHTGSSNDRAGLTSHSVFTTARKSDQQRWPRSGKKLGFGQKTFEVAIGVRQEVSRRQLDDRSIITRSVVGQKGSLSPAPGRSYTLHMALAFRSPVFTQSWPCRINDVVHVGLRRTTFLVQGQNTSAVDGTWNVAWHPKSLCSKLSEWRHLTLPKGFLSFMVGMLRPGTLCLCF